MYNLVQPYIYCNLFVLIAVLHKMGWYIYSDGMAPLIVCSSVVVVMLGVCKQPKNFISNCKSGKHTGSSEKRVPYTTFWIAITATNVGKKGESVESHNENLAKN